MYHTLPLRGENMPSYKKLSTTKQGARGLASPRGGKVSENPTKPKIAAKIKNSQGIGGGLKQRGVKSASKTVTSAKRLGTKVGLTQNGTTGRKPTPSKVGLSKMNLPKNTVNQPVSPRNMPKQPKNNFTLHNSVQKSDVARMRKAHNMGVPAMNGGSFAKFIGQ